jgi:hypothetical protein
VFEIDEMWAAACVFISAAKPADKHEPSGKAVTPPFALPMLVAMLASTYTQLSVLVFGIPLFIPSTAAAALPHC